MAAGKVSFNDLPESIREKIYKVLSHREEVRTPLVAIGSVVAVGTASAVVGFSVAPPEEKSRL